MCEWMCSTSSSMDSILELKMDLASQKESTIVCQIPNTQTDDQTNEWNKSSSSSKNSIKRASQQQQ